MSKEIIEGNKTIAEFVKEIKGIGFVTKYPFTSDRLKFHSSLDWLKPVLQKLESTGLIILIEFSENTICCQIKKGRKLNIIADNEGENAIWKSAVEAINWYNQNKKP